MVNWNVNTKNLRCGNKNCQADARHGVHSVFYR